jgi:hypothetical protein
LVAHPGDDGGFGPLFDGDTLRAGDGAAPDRRCVLGYRTGEPVAENGVVGMESQERHHRPEKIFDVLGLGLITAAGVGLFPFGLSFRGSLGFEFSTNPLDSRRHCPHSP